MPSSSLHSQKGGNYKMGPSVSHVTYIPCRVADQPQLKKNAAIEASQLPPVSRKRTQAKHWRPYQWVRPEPVGQHHPLAESLVLVILLGQVSWTINPKSCSIHCRDSSVFQKGQVYPPCAQLPKRRHPRALILWGNGTMLGKRGEGYRCRFA